MTRAYHRQKDAHNPHGLTDRQVQMLDLLREHGCWTEVGRLTGTTRHNIQVQIGLAAQKIGAPTPLLALLEWDRMKNKRAALNAKKAASTVFEWRL